MSYIVDYYTLALMKDGTNGNIKMETGKVFTDSPIELIPEHLNDFLHEKKRIGVVTNIKYQKGNCIGYNFND